MKPKVWLTITLLVMLATLVVACGDGAEATDTPQPEPTKEEAQPEPTKEEAGPEPTEAPAAGEKATVNMWSHAAGNPDEIAVVEQIIADFNAGQDQYEVALEAFPQASYNDSVAAASVAGSLPCLIDLDGPTVPNFAWSGYIQPLPVSEAELAEMGVLANDVGRYKDDVYSLGQFDVALLLYGRKSVLEKYDIRLPTLDEPWTLDEFNAILETLQGSGEFENALDVNAGWDGEWWPYAYSPMLQSFGGDLIDRATYLGAEGVLNGPEAQAWAEWFQGLFSNGYANPTPADDQGFFQGRVALWYTGSWSANAAVEAWGDDLLFLPMADLGRGPKIGAGSWQWGISATCEQTDGAWAFIKYIMEPEQIALMSETTGLIPTTEAAANLTDSYGQGGPYRVFYEMADRYALVRPPTPGYLIISSEFERAGLKIRDGENVLDALDDAVDAIERDIEDHDNYGFEAAAPVESPTGEKATVNMWSHAAGNPDEIAVVEQIIADFNAGQDQYEVVLEAFPQASYNDSVAAASVAGSLPCLIDLDGPTVPNFAWSGYIQPLPVSEAELAAMGVLANDVGRYKDDVYSLGQFDVALLLYGRKSVLAEYDIRVPTLDEPWTLDEFNAILETLQGSGEFENALDVNAGWDGEWWPYAYSPMLQSFGGDLIDRATYLGAEGVLNGPEAQAWAEWFQGLFSNGYANPTPADDQGFFQGRVALWYTGSWSANAAVEAWGDDLLFLPMADLGQGPKIGAGSWQWGISATCEQTDGAWAFIEYVMEPEQIALMSETTGLIPTTEAAANLTDNYGQGGPYRVFYEMADRYALVRPPTPGYLIISSEFERAGLKIRDGENVLDALDDAVDAIERDIEDHDNYGFQG